MSDTKYESKCKRRLLSYSLRSLFVVVTILSIAMSYWTHRVNRQKAALKWVEENGGKVYYDFEIDKNGESIEKVKPPGPKLVRSLLGIDYLSTVVSVDLYNCRVKDITPLAKLEHLRALTLEETEVSDLTPLTRMTSLQVLYLDHTNVSKEHIVKLQRLLPNCTIQHLIAEGRPIEEN